jgi:hypothetical protein
MTVVDLTTQSDTQLVLEVCTVPCSFVTLQQIITLGVGSEFSVRWQ